MAREKQPTWETTVLLFFLIGLLLALSGFVLLLGEILGFSRSPQERQRARRMERRP